MLCCFIINIFAYSTVNNYLFLFIITYIFIPSSLHPFTATMSQLLCRNHESFISSNCFSWDIWLPLQHVVCTAQIAYMLQYNWIQSNHTSCHSDSMATTLGEDMYCSKNTLHKHTHTPFLFTSLVCVLLPSVKTIQVKIFPLFSTH